MIGMTQNEYESIADEGLEELKSKTPKQEVELKKVNIKTASGEK